MKQIWISKAGKPEVLQIRESEDPTPARGEIRVRVAGAGINFADIMARMGQYPDLPYIPIVPGYEVAGVVDAVGDEVEDDWLGKEVLALTRFGGYSDVVCIPHEQAVIKPPNVSMEEAAGFCVNYLTAWMLMVVMGGLKEGETVLVHSAGGGVGIAAIQIANHLGAKVIGTASKKKHDFLHSLGVEHTIDYRTEDFEKRTLEVTRGQGVELVLDAVGGPSFKKSYNVLAPSGRLGMFGLSSSSTGKSGSILSLLKAVISMPWFRFNPVNLMNENKAVFGLNLGRLWEYTPRVQQWLSDMVPLMESGALKPRIDEVFGFSEAADAHHYIQDRKNIGKVLLLPD